MDTQRNIPKSSIAIIAILAVIVGLSCLFSPASKTPTISTDQNLSPLPSPIATIHQSASPTPPLAPPVTQAAIPAGWKLSKDPDGKCQVATPSDWQLGKDFFLKADKTDASLFANGPGHLPPMGLAMWGIDQGTQLPEGKSFQLRTAQVIGENVCSVWRIKVSTDFTDAQKSEMEQVGKTLQEVH